MLPRKKSENLKKNVLKIKEEIDLKNFTILNKLTLKIFDSIQL